MFDETIWIPAFALLGVLLIIRAAWKPVKGKRYVISEESLKASHKVAMEVLPLLESVQDVRDTGELPYPKDKLKSALKILAYQFARNNQHEELTRIKNAFVQLSRFQNLERAGDRADSLHQKENGELEAEINRHLLTVPRA
ncbi:hypothetical protein [Desulfovibrio oxyclinae]|uniref:hypothetical protein n=1 Tax=Desulfovibrio oxyclinae TaxID=63560 RepID=UPI0003777536|nr:hypothetical protein [Desulfovibrio oxyclinae]